MNFLCLPDVLLKHPVFFYVIKILPLFFADGSAKRNSPFDKFYNYLTINDIF
jgi:hypothetical protein